MNTERDSNLPSFIMRYIKTVAVISLCIPSLFAQKKEDSTFLRSALPSESTLYYDSTYIKLLQTKYLATDSTEAADESFAENEELNEDQLEERLSRIRGIVAFASKVSGTHPSVKDSLMLAVGYLSEALESEGLEDDFDFLRVAFSVLKLVREKIGPLDQLDSDNPAVAIHERLFETPDQSAPLNETLFQGLFIPKTKIPLVLTPEVKRFIVYFSTTHRNHFERYLHRAAIYFPTVLNYIREEGAPPELIYLSLIESGVNPHARSRANALGMWQFMKGTGKLYGLYGNQWFDERRNLEKSTRASARHMNDLYMQYGDWYLALAAYNAGPGRVNRGLRLSKDKSFWALRKYFRRETKEYVPRYIAAAIIALNAERFGFNPLQFGPELKWDEVPIQASLHFDVISSFTGISRDTLSFLNPELTLSMTPPAVKSYSLKVPKGSGAAFQEAVSSIPETELGYFIAYKTKSNESAKVIAKRFGVSLPFFMSFNHLKTDMIQKGRVVMIPSNPVTFEGVSYTTKDLSDDSREARPRRYKKRKTAKSAASITRSN